MKEHDLSEIDLRQSEQQIRWPAVGPLAASHGHRRPGRARHAAPPLAGQAPG